ncbi:MAG: RadC family protein [Omnitrophica WOR_2 bacterium]
MDTTRPSYRITDLDVSERPRERLAKAGPDALSNAELLAILIRVGVPGENAVQVGQRLLKTYGGISGIYTAEFNDICTERGIGPAKAAQIKAAIELGHRMARETRDELPTVHSPSDAASIVQYEMGALEHEELRVMLLDTRNRVLDTVTIYQGSTNSSQVRVAEIFRTAIRRNICAIIVLHNHPSGDPAPSPDDTAVTRAIVQAGKLLDIEVLDHLVIGKQGRFVSMKEKGLGWS